MTELGTGNGDVDTGDFEGLAPQEATDADERFGDDPRPGYRPEENEYDPPDSWAGANRHGTTAAEEAEGASLDQRLREEQPDVDVVAESERATADTPLDQLDESIDDMVADRPGGGEDVLDQPGLEPLDVVEQAGVDQPGADQPDGDELDVDPLDVHQPDVDDSRGDPASLR